MQTLGKIEASRVKGKGMVNPSVENYFVMLSCVLASLYIWGELNSITDRARLAKYTHHVHLQWKIARVECRKVNSLSICFEVTSMVVMILRETY